MRVVGRIDVSMSLVGDINQIERRTSFGGATAAIEAWLVLPGCDVSRVE